MAKLRKSGDIFSRRKRSELMSAIRETNTKLETGIFRELRAEGCRFKTHYSAVVGKPDIAIPSKKRVVFIDSDFWHGWRYPRWTFSTKNAFWDAKITANRARDAFVTRKLRSSGWKVLRVREHQLKKDRAAALKKIKKFLNA
jgi:DNA mismatch endonuclease (patch repair protein)